MGAAGEAVTGMKGQGVSSDLYPERLYWAGGKGLAKLNGEELKLHSCPQIFPGVVIDALDYAPNVVAQYMPRFGGWTEMTGEQQTACARHLRQVFGVERRLGGAP